MLWEERMKSQSGKHGMSRSEGWYQEADRGWRGEVNTMEGSEKQTPSFWDKAKEKEVEEDVKYKSGYAIM